MQTEREQVLLSPEEYFDLADRHLRSCPFRKSDFDGPCIDRSKGVYHLGGTLLLEGGYMFEFADTCYKESKFSLLRYINYDFRAEGAKDEMFRFDNHGDLLALNEPCHLHLDGGLELYEGDARLNGYSLIDMHLLEAVGLVCKLLRGEKLPWQ